MRRRGQATRLTFVVITNADGCGGITYKNLIIDASIDDFDPNRLDATKEKELVQALEKITGQNFGDDRAKWQEWWEKNKRMFDKGK